MFLSLFYFWSFEIFGIEISLTTIMSLFVGVFIGMLLTLLLYMLAVIRSIGGKDIKKSNITDGLTEDEVKDMLNKAIESFNDDKLRGEDSKIVHCGHICYDLTYSIASIYAKKSKYPMFEVTVSEALLLTEYVKKRIDEVLNHGALKAVRYAKISTIINISKKSNAIIKSEVVETTRTILSLKKKLDYIISPVMRVIKKPFEIVQDKIIETILRQVICIVGEEAYKLYSKKVFTDSIADDLLGLDEQIISEEFSKEQKEAKSNDVIDTAVKPIVSNIFTKFKTKPLKSESVGQNIYEAKADTNCKFKERGNNNEVEK